MLLQDLIQRIGRRIPDSSPGFPLKARDNIAKMIFDSFVARWLGVAKPLNIIIPVAYEKALEDAYDVFLSDQKAVIAQFDPTQNRGAQIKALTTGLSNTTLTHQNQPLIDTLLPLLTNTAPPPPPTAPKAKPKPIVQMQPPAQPVTNAAVSTVKTIERAAPRIRRLASGPFFPVSTTIAMTTLRSSLQKKTLQIDTDATAALNKLEDELKIANAQSTREPYTLLAEHVEDLQVIFLEHAKKNFSSNANQFLARLQFGLINIVELLLRINNGRIPAAALEEVRTSTVRIVKSLAFFQVYPLVRGSFKDTTNYITQPFSNLIEVLFEGFILGCEHKSKIDELINHLNTAIVEFGTLTRLIQFSDESLNFFQKIKTGIICLQAVLRSLKDEYRDQYPVDTGYSDLNTWATNKLANRQQFLTSLVNLLEQCTSDVIDALFIDPMNPPATLQGGLDTLRNLYPELDHLMPGKANPKKIILATRTFDEEVENIVAKSMSTKVDIPHFSSVTPPIPVTPVEQLQFLIFLTVHSSEFAKTISLEKFVQHVYMHTFEANAKYETHSIETVQTNNSNASLTYYPGQIGAETSATPLQYLKGFYNDLITATGKRLQMDPGLGYYIEFKDSNGDVLGVLTRKRVMKNERVISTTYGGVLPDAKMTLEEAINAFIAFERKDFAMSQDPELMQRFDERHAQLKALILSGSHPATILTRYKPGDARELYCFMAINIPWVVKDLAEAQSIISLLNSHPQGREYALVSPQDLRQYYHTPPADIKLLAKIGTKPFYINQPAPAATSQVNTSATSSTVVTTTLSPRK